LKQVYMRTLVTTILLLLIAMSIICSTMMP
jgi:hypothetical protein